MTVFRRKLQCADHIAASDQVDPPTKDREMIEDYRFMQGRLVNELIGVEGWQKLL